MTDLILYTTDDGHSQIKLWAKDQTVWLTQLEMAELFDATKQNISLHLKNLTWGQHERTRTTACSDESVRLFYTFYPQTLVGAKWLCVVVKYVGSDAFVITAYLTDKPKLGAPLWPIS